MKKKNIKKLFIIIALVYVIVFSINTTQAAVLNTKSQVNVGETFTVTLDFGEYIAAYDSFKVTFNNKAIEYISGDKIDENLWWDTSEESTGIRTKTFTFRGKADGMSDIKIKVEGLVSANATMDTLGNIELIKTIKVGTGYQKGDLNKDGLVDSADAAIALNIFKYNNATQENIKIGDMDLNGMIDSADAAMILNVFKYGI